MRIATPHVAGLAALGLAFAACNTANFGATSDRKGGDGKGGGRPGANGPNDEDAAATGGNPGSGGEGDLGNPAGGAADDATDQQNGADGGGDSGGNGGVDGGDGGNNNGELIEECGTAGLSTMRFVMVFDASSSQDDSDPTNVRVEGARRFLNELSGFAKKHPSVKVEIANMGFNRGAIRGMGWRRLGKSTPVADVASDMQRVATELKHCTNYGAALQEAQNLLREAGAKASVKTERNFIAFLSDGAPNRAGDAAVTFIGCPANDDAAILAKVNEVAKSEGAAFLTAATGTDIEASGEAILRSMALPAAGVVTPKHVGAYKRASSGAELRKLVDFLAGAVATSCD